MPNRKFPVLGTSVPPMLGREAILQKMLTALTKPVPDHLQIVGPRFAGKTVILHELSRRLREAGTSYTAVVMWDLGHHTPETDELFMQRFANNLSGALATNHADYAELLKSPEDRPYESIAEILEALKAEDGIVLVIMDGFDKPLSNGRLTRNLWDQLRELALKPSLRLITASRRTLRELIRSPDAQTSDFWGIFDPAPVRIGCFNAEDLTAILNKLDEIRLSGGAKTELLNATNGFPVLALEMLNVVEDEVRSGEVKADVVANACGRVRSTMDGTIESLWNDCSPQIQDVFRRVMEEQSILRTGIATADCDGLADRGFVQIDGNKLQRANRLLCQFLEDRPGEGSSLVRLFATDDVYLKHFKGVMEHRISHLIGIDPTLKRFLLRAVEDLPAHPDVFLSNIRGIVDQAFALIWEAEVPNKHIPSEWMAIWKRNNERNVEDWETRFPQGVHRVRLLNLMTGTERSDPCAKFVSKSTYVLINAAHGFGDFGQHQEGEKVNPGTAYAALLLCIELSASLTRELPGSTGRPPS
jgi:hypothetical protein